MFSSFTSLGKGRHHEDRSPFVSPHTALLSAPVAARRSSLEERRRPAAEFNQIVSPGVTGKIDEEREEEEEGDEQDLDDGLDEDGDEDFTPLLPIFSAAHLGSFASPTSSFAQFCNSVADESMRRFLTRVQPYAYHSHLGRSSMRDNPFVGPAKVAPSFTVPYQTNPAANSSFTLFEGHSVRAVG